MRHRFLNCFTLSITLSGVGFALQANPAKAQTTYYFDTNGSTAGFGTLSGTYDWDATTNGGLWDASSAGTGPTIGWTQGQFPRFAPTGTPTYSVTVSNQEQIAGMFMSTAQNLTINATGSGALSIVSGLQGIINSTSATTVINAPITGLGQIDPSNGGNISLNGINTYIGGTLLTSSATLLHFNNGSAFGTGNITNNIATATSFAPLLASGGTTITLPNNFDRGATSGAGFNFAADANTPVVSTGTWSLGALNLNLRNNGTSTSPLTLTNTISGTGSMILSGANGGAITFSGANTYSGTTTVGVTGATAITLKLGAANTIASTSSLILAGGTVNTGGFNQNMSASTLSLLATSTIDFSAGASEMDFADSSGLTWSGTLNLLGWNPAVDALRFGTSGTGLTAAQLARIQFNGAGLGTAALNSSGFLVVGGATVAPEPGTFSLLGLGLCMTPAVCFLRRRSMR